MEKRSGSEVIRMILADLEDPAEPKDAENNDVISEHSKMDASLSKERKNLRLNGVWMPKDDELRLLDCLVHFRFYSEETVTSPSIHDIGVRMDLVLEQISSLLDYPWKKIDEVFLYIAECIARNLYILKQQMKCTYVRIPWEEMVFCLVCFISAHMKRAELNVFCWAILTRENILENLRIFQTSLHTLRENLFSYDTNILNTGSRSTREDVISLVLEGNPEFGGLYGHYEELKDVYSLQKMTNYIEAVLLADVSMRQGQLVVKRALQVVGEHLKNSLESPNLSKTISDLILLSAPTETRQVLTALRNSLSHAHIIQHKQANEEGKFYKNLQNDIKKLGFVIGEILLRKKKKLVKILLSRFDKSTNLDDINKIFDDFKDLHVLTKVDMTYVDHTTNEDKVIGELIKMITEDIGELSDVEKELLNQINNIIYQNKHIFKNNLEDFAVGFGFLKTLFHPSLKMNQKNKSNEDIYLTITKRTTSEMLKRYSPLPESSNVQTFEELSRLLEMFSDCVKSKVSEDLVERLYYTRANIHHITMCEKKSIRWIDDFKEQLGKQKSNNKKGKKQQNVIEEVENAKIDSELIEKLAELKATIRNNPLTQVEGDKCKIFMIEMMFLDVLSDLDTHKCLIGNILFIDGDVPLLTGKCLRNYLAHGNPLIDIFFQDVFTTIYSNAAKLAENDGTHNKKIGHVVNTDVKTLKSIYDDGLTVVRNMIEMQKALKGGNLEVLKMCIEKGADPNYKSVNMRNALHLAAQGPNFEVFKFLINQHNLEVKENDLCNQNPLHVAAAYGRTEIVQFLTEEKGFSPNKDDKSRSTPLHIAAQNGHTETVKRLLELGADRKLKDWVGYCPIHYAIRNNHLQAVKILLDKDVNMVESSDGFTLLHIAADLGYSEIVTYLLDNKADVDTKSFTGATPLYFAALNGHPKVVETLIDKGANINFKGLYSGCTPLNNAAEKGHEEVVKILLQHGASVNVGNKSWNQMPLHAAASFGHAKIVKELIDHGADVNALRYDRMIPIASAIIGGHTEIVEILLKKDSRIDCWTDSSMSLLHLCALRNNSDIAKILVAAGINVNSINRESMTPLAVAAVNSNYEMVETLLDAGADVDCMNTGFPALHFSVNTKHFKISQALIKRGADVNSRNKSNRTPLFEALNNTGDEAIVQLLVDNGGDVTAKDSKDLTPLHMAALLGHKGTADILIKAKADVNAKSIYGVTPLHLAVEGNHKSVVEVLIANKSNVNAVTENNVSVLYEAVKNNHRELVDFLITKGADVNICNGICLITSVEKGFRNVVDALLRNKNIDVTVRDENRGTLLHIAALNGNWNTAKALIKKGCDMEAVNNEDRTPLESGIILGQVEFVDVLIENGAKVDSSNIKQLICLAVLKDLDTTVRKFLDLGSKNLDRGIFAAMRLAIITHKMELLKILLEHQAVDIDTKCHKGYTLLHLASTTDLDIVKYLVNAGANVEITDNEGAKAIHLASKTGKTDIIEYFLQSGINVNCEDEKGNNLLHFAAIGIKNKCAEYLIEQGANINAINIYETQPIHIASQAGASDLVNNLLKNGAFYDKVDSSGNKPKDLTDNHDVIQTFELIESLFEAVELNDMSAVKTLLKDCAIVDAKRHDNLSLLHIATKKGFKNICDVLLQHKSNPNVTDEAGCTPLHYASRNSHLEIVLSLLKRNAIYNAVSNDGKTPLDLTENESIKTVLEFIHEAFCKIQNGDEDVVEDLNEIKDLHFLNAVMNAQNTDRKTLASFAAITKFPKLEQLRSILHDSVSQVLMKANSLILEERFDEALPILISASINRIVTLGGNDLGTLEVQAKIADVYCKIHKHEDALVLLKEIHRRQTLSLGENCEESLRTHSTIAFILHKQGLNESALDILEDVCPKQVDLLTENHKDVLESRLRLGLVLKMISRHTEALELCKKNHTKCLELLGTDNIITLDTYNQIGNILYCQGKAGEAIDIFRSVSEGKKRILGKDHSDTMRAEHNVGAMLASQGKLDEAAKILHPVFSRQKILLGTNHIDTINTQRNIACVHFFKGDYLEALKAYKDGRKQRDLVLGPKNPDNVILNKIFKDLVTHAKKVELDFDEINNCQIEVMNAVMQKDEAKVESLIQNGCDVNTKDSGGRTLLHYAASRGNVTIVNMLLKHGANPTTLTSEGNSVLHAAVYNDHPDIVEILLKNVTEVKSDRFNGFINAETVLAGTTALHAASKINATNIARILLKNGAQYNLIDRLHDQTPVQYAKDDICDLLTLIDEFFDSARKDDVKVIDKLVEVENEGVEAVVNARNEEMLTALEQAEKLGNHIFAAALSKRLETILERQK